MHVQGSSLDPLINTHSARDCQVKLKSDSIIKPWYFTHLFQRNPVVLQFRICETDTFQMSH
jgi:hypothetical protein